MKVKYILRNIVYYSPCVGVAIIGMIIIWLFFNIFG